MKRRWIQNLCIVLVFALGFGAVIYLGMNKEINGSIKDGISLKEKGNRSESSPKLEDETVVYVTKTGTKYHLDTKCTGLRNAKEITGVSLSSAEKDGKTPCALCGEGSE